MPRRAHGHGDGAPRPRSVREAEEHLVGKVSEGRLGKSTSTPLVNDLITSGTGRSGGLPEGPPTVIRPGTDEENQRSLTRENEAAATLADRGYRVRQNPTRLEVARARKDTGDVGSPIVKPDYLIEGRVFDCYSPSPEKPVRGIHSMAEKKVAKGQTQRLVVNLADWPGDVSAVRDQFASWPIPGFKELKIITSDGKIVQIPLGHDKG